MNSITTNRILFVAGVLFFGCGATAVQAVDIPTTANHISYVQIPSDLSRDDVAAADRALKDRLHDYAKTVPLPVEVAESEPPIDLIIVFTDKDDVPILPDFEQRRQRIALDREKFVGCPTNEINFTFDSTSYPWNAEELAVLNAWLDEFYPAAKDICGNPFFGITANLRKDPTISFAGLYYPTLNEMVIQGTNSPDVLCHEMIHAFRDDFMIGLNSFEEGMTRAAEVEVFNQLADFTHWDENHQYGYDVYYEGINRQVLGGQGGSFFYGLNALLRYQLSGYAWAKCFFENTNFLAQFNCELYQQTLADPSTHYIESKLVAIAATVQPAVEGTAFLEWYRQQGVLNVNPPKGFFLFQRINQFTLDYFFRNEFGGEIPQANATIEWTLFDHQDRVLDSGSGVTTSFGWTDAYPNRLFTNSYAGRLRLVAQTMSSTGLLVHTAFRPTGPFGSSLAGIFGVVVTCDLGALTITPLDAATAPITVPVVNGAFSAPSLGSDRGRFLAEFRTSDGMLYTRQFNKDAGDYFLELRPPILITRTFSSGVWCLTLRSELDRVYQIEATTNFTGWESLFTLTNLTGDIDFTVSDPTSIGKRFYRAKR